MKSMSHPLAEIGDVVTSGVSDAWAATSALAQELAATAANAVEVVHPKPARSRFNPWLLVVAGHRCRPDRRLVDAASTVDDDLTRDAVPDARTAAPTHHSPRRRRPAESPEIRMRRQTESV